MKEYIKKFESASTADNYPIADIPFTTSVATDPIQNLVCNQTGKKLVNVGGIVQIQSAGPEMVDLGLSVKWAATNLGATNADTVESWYGDFYAWGETETKSDYSWATYTRHTNGTYSSSNKNVFIKYIPTDKTEYWGGEGDPDNKLVLDAVDDIATQTYGLDYRMPTRYEIQELINGTVSEWITDYNGITGLNGRKFMKKSDHSVFIFIPAAGYFIGSTRYGTDSRCYLWSSSLYWEYPYGAEYFEVEESTIRVFNFGRSFGFSVRVVKA